MAEGYVDTSGVRLWYEQTGDPEGPPVLFLLGTGASAVWWPPTLLNSLATAGCRVVRYDSRDVGLSTYVDFETAPFALDDLAADAVAVLDTLGIRRVHLVGMSLGGMIGQVVALRRPDRVASLTLISTTPGPDERLTPSTDEFIEVVSREPDVGQDHAELELEFCRAVSGSRFPFDESYYRSLIAADQARGMNPNSSPPNISSSRIDALVSIGVPTLVVHGTEDPVYPYDHAEALAKAIPEATLVLWEGVGHEIPPPLVPELTELVSTHIGAPSCG